MSISKASKIDYDKDPFYAGDRILIVDRNIYVTIRAVDEKKSEEELDIHSPEFLRIT